MIKSLVNTLINYLETKLEIYKLQFKEEVGKAFTVLILVILFSMVLLLVILFLSLFFVEILNNLLNNNYYGYLIVAGFYVIMGILVYSLRNKIRDTVTNAIISDEQDKIEK